MNTLKIKTKIQCNTCGCTLSKVKSIKVISSTESEAKEEVKLKIADWKLSIKETNCKVCASIIKEMAE